MTLDFEFLHNAINECQDLIEPPPSLLGAIGYMVDRHIDENPLTNLYVSGHFAAMKLASVLDEWPENKDTYVNDTAKHLAVLDMSLYMSFKEYRAIGERENSYCHRTFTASQVTGE